jgi:hypothetical protein
MIEIQTATVYFAPTRGRRYLSKDAAITAEAKALIKRRYPTEHSEYEDGRMVCEGWHWAELKNSEKLFRRVRLMVKNGWMARDVQT